MATLIANTHVCLLKGIHVYIVVVVVAVTRREAQTGRGILWAAIFVVNSGKFVHFFSGLNRFSM